MKFAIDGLIEQYGGLTAEVVCCWMGRGHWNISSRELAAILRVSQDTVLSWRRKDKTRPRHLRATLAMAEVLLMEIRGLANNPI